MTLKAYTAQFLVETKEAKCEDVTVAAQSMEHAARKACAKAKKDGTEVICIRLTTEVIV